MKKTLIIIIAVVVIALLAGLLLTRERPNEPTIEQKSPNAQVNRVEIFEFPEIEFDFGVIKQSGGSVQHEFSFTYNGEDSVSVTGVPTSCACTSAEIDKSVLQPGDSGTITVSFDPNLHAEPEGRFFKTITLLTDPELDDTPELKIWAEIDLDLGPDAYKLKIHDD